jgi:hypothetical protein
MPPKTSPSGNSKLYQYTSFLKFFRMIVSDKDFSVFPIDLFMILPL